MTDSVAEVLKKKRTKLKSARLARAEDLDEKTRKEFNLPEEGMVVMETRQEDTIEDFKRELGKAFQEQVKELNQDIEGFRQRSKYNEIKTDFGEGQSVGLDLAYSHMVCVFERWEKLCKGEKNDSV